MAEGAIIQNILNYGPVFFLIAARAFAMIQTAPLLSSEAVPMVAKFALAGFAAFAALPTADVFAVELTAAGAAVLTGKLLQFCNGAVYGSEKQTLRVHDCKLEAYMELIEQLNGEPCMTFYGYKHDLDRLLERLKKTKLRVRVYSGPKDEDEWNAGRIDVLLAHPAACAYGLNLQAGGRHVVWFGLNWSFELNDQGRCRLWRQGSEYDRVYIHYLVITGCVDEDVMDVIRDRADTHEAVMRALKARLSKIKKGKEA